MKKFTRIITAAIISAGFMGSVASAATCTTDVVIDNSGNGNTTTVTCDNEQTATITCTNNVIVGNYNVQEGESGGGSSEGGSVESGSVVNYNGTETTIDAPCTTASDTSTETPATTAPTTNDTPAVTSLPNTASNDTATIIAMSLAAAAIIVGLSRAGIAIYRHVGTK